MDTSPTRRTLHAVAELLLAGPQYAASGTIRLRALPGGLATVAAPDLRMEGTDLVGGGGRRPLEGTYADVAAAAGIEPRPLDDVYRDTAGVGPHDEITLDAGALRVLVDALTTGADALRAFAPDQEPVVWPEHLDVAIAVGEVNYGVSPGDALIAEPYAYVGPWSPRRGEFWNQSFGSARPVSELGGVDGLTAYFQEGARRAAADPGA